MVPLIGYVDRFSARPGERIAIKVSSQLDQPYQADLIRIIHADPNPAGHQARADRCRFRRYIRIAIPAGPPGIVRRGHAR